MPKRFEDAPVYDWDHTFVEGDDLNTVNSVKKIVEAYEERYHSTKFFSIDNSDDNLPEPEPGYPAQGEIVTRFYRGLQDNLIDLAKIYVKATDSEGALLDVMDTDSYTKIPPTLDWWETEFIPITEYEAFQKPGFREGTGWPPPHGFERRKPLEIFHLDDRVGEEGQLARFCVYIGRNYDLSENQSAAPHLEKQRKYEGSPGGNVATTPEDQRKYAGIIFRKKGLKWIPNEDQLVYPTIVKDLYGVAADGDILGPWILNDIKKAIRRLRRLWRSDHYNQSGMRWESREEGAKVWSHIYGSYDYNFLDWLPWIRMLKEHVHATWKKALDEIQETNFGGNFEETIQYPWEDEFGRIRHTSLLKSVNSHEGENFRWNAQGYAGGNASGGLMTGSVTRERTNNDLWNNRTTPWRSALVYTFVSGQMYFGGGKDNGLNVYNDFEAGVPYKKLKLRNSRVKPKGSTRILVDHVGVAKDADIRIPGSVYRLKAGWYDMPDGSDIPPQCISKDDDGNCIRYEHMGYGYWTKAYGLLDFAAERLEDGGFKYR